jgi:outer membrane protein
MSACLRTLTALLLMASLAVLVKPSTAAEILTPPSPPAGAQARGQLEISLAEAILMALENNRSLAVQRIAPAIAQSFEDEARAAFDPVVSAGAFTQRYEGRSTAAPGDPTGTDTARGRRDEGFIALDTFFPTGTLVSVEAAAARTDAGFQNDAHHSSRLGVAVSQALLRGFGREVNLAMLRQARLETHITLYELQGFSEALVAAVEDAYWDYALSLRQIEIVRESLNLAEQQLAETQSMIDVGVMAEAELPAVQAEVALQRQGLINVKNARDASRLRLLHLLNPPGGGLWDREVTLAHPPAVPVIVLDAVEDHVARGLRQRPEVNQAELEIGRGELEVVRTKNGLLPRLELFINLGKSGYADSFGGAVSDLDGSSYDTRVGFSLEYPLANRGARARHRRATLGREQAEKALDNMNLLVELDIRNAYLEVDRTREQISAGAATREWQEEKLRIETEKFRVGRSTNLLVAQAQRDLLVSRIEEVRSVVDYLKALTHFYHMEGSLLERRGIQMPFDPPLF